MAQLKSISKKLVLIIVTISLLLTFVATPSAEAKLTLGEGEYYYSGTTKGTYKASTNIFSWLLANIGDIADWLLGIMTMGIRMVFVGWTALIEKILTWTLEGTTGVETEDGVSSTDLSSISDSSNNITVQAIVYNQVPAFDVNFFNLDYDKTYSGTGKKLHCDKCDKDVDEEGCCDPNGTGCACACKGNCDDCQRYIAALNVKGDPIIVQIKKVVATWYYVMRFLAAAALLIVFIGVGLKMALSTIASEKAVYKRMLVDWVVGAILVFAIHYIMIFVVYMNGALIKVVKESANSINKVSMMQLAEKSDTNIEYTDEELEISIYEAVRTRAYDPKLMNGLTGMLMYMTLVYFAIRYSIVYLKRLLTLIVLTLMAPAVGVSYAIQKVFSGKSQSLTNWGTEYTMNVLIQVVHAIIYSVFISTALILSLQSVAGMILALILMNYSLKAEKTFRTIFKMGAGGSLLDHTASAGDAEKIQEGFNTAKGLAMGAKPVAGALMKTPYAKALTGAAKLGVAGGLYAGSKVKQGANALKERYDSKAGQRYENAVDKEMERVDGTSEAFKNSQGKSYETDQEYEARRNAAKQRLAEKNPKKYGTGINSAADADANLKTLIQKGESGLKQDIVDAMAKGDKEGVATAIGNYNKFEQSGAKITTGKIIKGHAEKLVDVKNHYSLQYNEDGSIKFGSILKTVMGTEHKDLKTGKYVSDRNAFYHDLAPDRLLGFTPEDKKIFKEQVIAPIRNGFGGIAAMFIGMGTMVAHPSLGLPMAVGGATIAGKALKKPISAGDYKGTYTFARFGSPTVAKIQKEALKRARREWNREVVKNVKKNHPDLYKSLKSDISPFRTNVKNVITDLGAGLGAAGTLGTLAAIGGAAPMAVPLAVTAVSGAVGSRLMRKTGFAGRMDTINQHAAKQLQTQQLKFAEEGYQLQANIKAAEYQDRFNSYTEKTKNRIEAEVMAEEGFVLNEATKQWETIEQASINGYNRKMEEIYASKGLSYNASSGTITSTQSDGSKQAVKVNLDINDFSGKDKNNPKKRMSNNDFKKVQQEVNTTIEKILAENPNADMQDAETQKRVEAVLSDRLVSAGIIKKGQKAESIFKGGQEAMAEVLGKQVDFKKAKMEAATTALDGMDEKTRSAVEGVISDIRKNGSSATRISANSIFKKLEGDGSTAADGNKDGSVKLSNIDRARVEQFAQNLSSSVQTRETKSRDVDVLRARRKAEERIASRKAEIKDLATLSFDDDTITELTTAIKTGKSAKISKNSYRTPEERAKRRNIISSLDVINSETKNNKLYETNMEAIDPTKDGTLVVDASDTKEVLELLLMRKELQALNHEATEELKLKKGPADFNKATKEESKAKVRKYKAQLELEQFNYQQDRNSTYGQTDKEQAFAEAKRLELENNLNRADELLRMAIEEKTIHGPVVNVDEFLSDIIRTADSDTQKYMRMARRRNESTYRQKIDVRSEQAARKQAQKQKEQELANEPKKQAQQEPVKPKKPVKPAGTGDDKK